MDVGLLILRVVAGVALVGHGTQKLFGWFGGQGRRGTAPFFEMLGYRPGELFATLLMRRSAATQPAKTPAHDEARREVA